MKQQWVIPPEQNAEFVAAMEDVLEVYERPYDPQYPVVCLDEQSKQLIAETRTPITAAAGRPARVDYEYERRGTANLFMQFEPLGGRRRVKVTARRTLIDFAHVLRELVDEEYPAATKIVVVMDNLNTHRPAALYEAFAAEGGPPDPRPPGNSLHAQTWQLAQHGGNGTQHPHPPVSRPSHRRLRLPDQRSRRLADPAQSTKLQNQLAIHYHQRSH